MLNRLRPHWPDLGIILLLLILPLILFAPVTLGGRTLIPADNLYQWEPFASYAEVVSAPETPHNALLSDLVLENYVWKGFIRDSIRGGEIPLWNPHLFAGVPFLAAGQHSALYPLSWLHYVLPLEVAYGWYTVIQLWLAGLFMLLLARGLGQGRGGALVAAVSWQLSGWFLARVVFPMILGAAAWLPLLILMVEFVIRARPLRGRPATLPWAAGGAIALGLVIYAGHVEITYYTLLIMGFYAAARLLTGWWAARHEAGAFQRVLRRGVWLLVMVGFGLALGAGQFLPLYELASRNFRAGSATLDEIRGWAYPARRVIAFFMPNFFGSPAHHAYTDVFTGATVPATVNALGNEIDTIYWGIKNYVEGGAYLGILPMALAVFGLVTRPLLRPLPHQEGGEQASDEGTRAGREGQAEVQNGRSVGMNADVIRGRSYRAIFAVIAAVSITFIFGTPTYALLYYGLPFVNQLHSPFRWVFALTLAVAVLAGFGADALAGLRRFPHQEGGAQTPTRQPADASPPAGEQTAPDAQSSAAYTRNVDSPFSPGGGRETQLLFVARDGGDRWAGRFGWTLLALGGIVLGVLLLSRVLYDQIALAVEWLFHGLALADHAFPDARAFYSYQFGNILPLGVLLIASGLVFLLSRSGRFGKAWLGLAVGVIALDLMMAFGGALPAADPALLDFTPPPLEWLQGQYEQDGPFRLTTLNAPGADTLHANIPWLYGLEDIRGYDSIIPRQYTDFMALISPQFQLDYNRVAPLTTDRPEALGAASLGSELLNLLNVRYLATEIELTNAIWQEVYRDDGSGVIIYENQHVMPHAFTLPADQSYTYATLEDFADLLAEPGVDTRLAVLVQDDDAPAFSEQGAILDDDYTPQEVVEYRNIQVTVAAAVDEPSWLVLADSYFPGWRAYARPLDTDENWERELDVHLVDGNFRGVRLDPAALWAGYVEDGMAEAQAAQPETWLVRFRYSPQSFQMGAFISFMAAAVILFGAGVWLWRAFYTGSGDPSSEPDDAGTMQRIAKNSVVPILMNLFNKGLDFAFAFIMLRVLGPEGAGIYYYAIVVFLWFDILTNFGLNTYLTREVARDRSQARRILLNTSALRLGLAGLGVPLLIGFLVARQSAFDPPLDPTAVIAIALLYLGLLPNSLSTGLSALFYAYEQAEYPAAITTVSTILSKAILGPGALLLGWGVIGLAGVSIITNALTLIIMLWAARGILWPAPSPASPTQGEGKVQPRRNPLLHVPVWGGLMGGGGLDRPLIRHMLGESWPLMINHLLATLFFKIDVILIEVINGVTVVGWYSTAYKWLDAIQVIPSFLSAALLPVMSRQAHDDPPALVRSFRLAVKLLALVALPVAVLTAFIAEALILVLGGSAYLPDGAIALQLIIWSIPIGWVNSVTQYMLIALDRQRILTRAFFIAVIFNVGANLILLPAYSYRAAAIITIFSEGLLLVLFLRVLASTLRERIPDDAAARDVSLIGMVWRPLVAAGVMLGVLLVAWGISPPLALLGGTGAYVGVLWVLRPFDAAEQAQLAPLLPGRLRARLSLSGDSQATSG